MKNIINIVNHCTFINYSKYNLRKQYSAVKYSALKLSL